MVPDSRRNQISVVGQVERLTHSQYQRLASRQRRDAGLQADRSSRSDETGRRHRAKGVPGTRRFCAFWGRAMSLSTKLYHYPNLC